METRKAEVYKEIIMQMIEEMPIETTQMLEKAMEIAGGMTTGLMREIMPEIVDVLRIAKAKAARVEMEVAEKEEAEAKEAAECNFNI